MICMNTLTLKEFLKVLLSNQAAIFAFTTSMANLNIYICLAPYTVHTYITARIRQHILRLFRWSCWGWKYCAWAFWQPHNTVSLSWRNFNVNCRFIGCYSRWLWLTLDHCWEKVQHFVPVKFRMKEPHLVV